MTEAHRLAEQSGVGRIVALATVVDGVLIAELGEVEAGEARLREGLRLQAHEGTERPIEALVELAEFQLRWRSVAAAADTLDEVERGLENHGSALLRARADLLRGRVLTEQSDDFAFDVLKQARDRFSELDRRLFVRDAEVAMARCVLRQGQREACRMHLSAAKAIHDDVAQDLPNDLATAFEGSAAQREASAVEGELNGQPGIACAP